MSAPKVFGSPPQQRSQPGGPAGQQIQSRQWWRPVVLLALVVAILVLAPLFGLGDKLGALRDWIKELGNLAPLVFILIYVAAALAALPASPFSVAAAALFGSVWGVIVVNIGSTLGAALAFLVGRYFARDAVVNWLGRKENFRRVDRLTEKHGAIIVALTRLVPIFPFNLLNYGFGLTRVPFWTYVFWTWLCIIPGTILYVVGADALLQGAAQGKIPWTLVGVFAAALILVAFLVHFARRRLKAGEQEGQSGPARPLNKDQIHERRP
ncbi:MAG: TVP38/TMEM64 family protein [Deltaproteobacteria bacterium]